MQTSLLQGTQDIFNLGRNRDFPIASPLLLSLLRYPCIWEYFQEQHAEFLDKLENVANIQVGCEDLNVINYGDGESLKIETNPCGPHPIYLY